MDKTEKARKRSKEGWRYTLLNEIKRGIIPVSNWKYTDKYVTVTYEFKGLRTPQVGGQSIPES